MGIDVDFAVDVEIELPVGEYRKGDSIFLENKVLYISGGNDLYGSVSFSGMGLKRKVS
jgi:hypothetical protein